MPLDKITLAAALETAFQVGMDDPDRTLAQSAAAIADAIDAYARGGAISGWKATSPIPAAIRSAMPCRPLR